MSPKTPTTRNAATNEQVVELKNIVEKLIEDNKQMKATVDEILKSTEFASNKYGDTNKTMNEVLNKLSKITEQNKKLIERNEFNSIQFK